MRSSVCSLFVCISVLLSAKHGDGVMVRNITAVLGQSVTLRCLANPNGVNRLYVQKDAQNDQVFINGFDVVEELSENPDYKNRTKVNKTDLSMEMSNISVYDEGLYKCVVFHNQTHDDQFRIYLKVTAEYNIPNMTAVCSEPVSDERSCRLSCSSTAGYPQSAVRWTDLNPILMSVIHNNSLQDPHSKTWTLSQTISYNCNRPTNISCSIGDAASHITICKTAKVEKFPLDAVVISAIAVLLLIIFIVTSLYIIRKCRRRAVPADEALEVPLADCRSQPQDR